MCGLPKVLAAGIASTSRHGEEVRHSGILLDLSTEGALEPGVASSFVVRVVRGRDAPWPMSARVCGGDMGWRRDELACDRSR